MKIYDLNNIDKVDGLYDLTQLTFRYDVGVPLSQYTVQKGEEMRMDLVCESIYNNTDYVDILCSINNIDNPLNIREGQIIVYPTSNIDILRYSEPETEDVVLLSNSNKTTRKDTNRKKYLENKLALPPTTLKKRTNQFNIDGENIILGRGLN
jgi:hypothetical protein